MKFHLVLLGDSIFDNATYVRDGDAVINQIRRRIPPDCRATLLAHDGDIAANVAIQLVRVPKDATHLVLSVGGNDALNTIPIMSLPAHTVGDAMGKLTQFRIEFQRAYRDAISQTLALGKPLTLCTIYEAIPGLPEELRTALSIFNDTIVREALACCLPVIDLREVCTDPGDYSQSSPIEPSEQGGRKIAEAILKSMAVRSSTDRPIG